MNLSGFVMKVLGMKMYLKNNNLTFPLAKLILLSPSCIENNLFPSMIYDMIRLFIFFLDKTEQDVKSASESKYTK